MIDTSVDNPAELENYAFLYGTFPTASAVFVFATQYNAVPDIIASATVAGTVISAPLMYISAKSLKVINVTRDDYVRDLQNFMIDIGIASVISIVIVTVIFIYRRLVHRSIPHALTFSLLFHNLVACVGAFIWCFADGGVLEGVTLHVQV